MDEAQNAKHPDGLRKNERKWTKPLMDAGYTTIPSIIFERQSELGLDAVDINIILHLARHWWFSENLPHPSKRTIAACMKVHPSTIRRRIASMEERGLISRTPRKDDEDGQTSNTYDLSGLIKAATPMAKAALDAKKRRAEQKAAKTSVPPADHQKSNH